jgi:tetratricopeptide (TPR) repeat protein
MAGHAQSVSQPRTAHASGTSREEGTAPVYTFAVSPIPSGVNTDPLGPSARGGAPWPQTVGTLVDGDVAPEADTGAETRGAAIGRYVILERVGSGGMGVVYAAWDPQLSRRVALKLLHGSDAPSGRGMRGQERLLREAQALARLTHPNVVTVHDVGTFGGRVFVAMEFVEGLTLTQWRQQKSPAWPEIVQILVAAGRGLAGAHAQGLVHRDFKPDNVLVGDDGRVRVVDFGLARSTGDTSVDEELPVPPEHSAPIAVSVDVRLTATGALAGTPAYMAPEQHNRLPPDARSDQFSFCVTAWEALYGERPFSGESRMILALNVCRGVLREPPAKRGVPTHVRRVLERGLSPDPSSRYGGIEELLHELSEDPRGRRNRRVATVGALAITGGLAFLAVRPADTIDPCATGDTQVAAAWGEDVRAGVREAFGAVDAPWAPPALVAVEKGMKDYASEWAHAYRDACEATAVRHEQSEDLLDRRMVCLRERMDAFEALGRVLTHADRDVVSRAAAAVADLPRLSPCGDTKTLMARVAPPSDPEVALQVDALRRELTDVRAAFSSGKYADALPLARDARRRAEEIGYEPLLAEAHFVEGSLAHAAGETEDAEVALEEAAFLALAVGHDEILARASTQLVSVVGVGRSRYEAGEQWGRQGEAAVRRLGERSAEAADHAGAMCMLLADEGASDRAMPWCERALSIALELWAPDHLNVEKAQRALGNAHYMAGDLDEAEAAYRRAWEIFEEVQGADHPSAAILLNTLAAVCHGRGKGAECIPLFADALAAAERGLGPEHPAVADFANNYAIALVGVGRLDEAERHSERSLQIRRSKQGDAHPGVGAAHQTLGSIAEARGDIDAALAHYDRAVEVFTATRGEAHHDVVAALQRRGAARLKADRGADAVADLERALTLGERIGPPVEIAEVRFALARALWSAAPRQRERARALARTAAAEVHEGPDSARLRAEIEAFVADPDAASTAPP